MGTFKYLSHQLEKQNIQPTNYPLGLGTIDI